MKTEVHKFEHSSKKDHFLKGLFLAVMIFILNSGLGKVYAQCGYALEFQDTSFAVVYSDQSQTFSEVSNNFTMEFWVKTTKSIKPGMSETVHLNLDYSGDSGQNYAICPQWFQQEPPIPDTFDWTYCCYNIGGPAGAGVSVGVNGVAVFEFSGWYQGAPLVYYTPISSTDWTHIAIVYIGKQPSLYINGSWVYTGVTSLKDRIHPSASIGIDVPWGPFDGTIDEFRIWDIPLSPATLSDWYDQPVTASHPDYAHLHTYWNFNEGPDTLVQDASGNGHVGYIWNSFDWIPGWIPEGATLPVVDAGADFTTYFGVSSMQEVTRTAVVTGGTPPFTFEWTIDRPLLCNQENSNGDETFSGGTCANTTCPESDSPAENASCSGSETVTATLLDTAVICVTVTDANGCITTDCFTVNASDVRCFSGNGGNSKVKMCHQNNNPNNPWVEICVDESAVDAHLAHGDDLGGCGLKREGYPGMEPEWHSHFNLHPNPTSGNVTVEFGSGSELPYIIKMADMTGRKLFSYQGITGSGENSRILDLEGIKPGIYLVTLVLDGKQEVRKIVKE